MRITSSKENDVNIIVQGQGASITIDTAILDFLPNGQHEVAAMANLGAVLLPEVKGYRPAFL